MIFTELLTYLTSSKFNRFLYRVILFALKTGIPFVDPSVISSPFPYVKPLTKLAAVEELEKVLSSSKTLSLTQPSRAFKIALVPLKEPVDTTVSENTLPFNTTNSPVSRLYSPTASTFLTLLLINSFILTPLFPQLYGLSHF